jgi:hypothetical protein
MTLTTHAIVGAAAASLFPTSPVLAFAAGFASHFAIDSLPHWDYRILSKHKEESNRLNDNIDVRNPTFILDLMRIGSDALLGTILSIFIFSVWLFHLPIWFSILGAWAGILPDPLQFVYYKTRLAIMVPLQRFHIWVQKGKSIHPPFYIGLLYQALLVAIILAMLVSL